MAAEGLWKSEVVHIDPGDFGKSEMTLTDQEI